MKTPESSTSDVTRFVCAERKISSDLSTELTLQWDPWKIKKKLTESDLNYSSRLLLLWDCVKTHVFQWMGKEMVDQFEREEGMEVIRRDADTGGEHWLVFHRWKSAGSYVLNYGWTKQFV
ncbi:putative B3 domain-containing protein At1g78640 [Eucalyptus grandis]|uniref:putative B3 domain-containing protein At1g78640 n=1 Tax=Eucalyptus grandis TaxID=71139 RepID=UPI00052540E1|nr:putative B3 domain-containing protein At1g78640 [Eucalyptus grandis]